MIFCDIEVINVYWCEACKKTWFFDSTRYVKSCDYYRQLLIFLGVYRSRHTPLESSNNVIPNK